MMIKVNGTIEEITGKMEEGDCLPSFCCEGHDWEVLVIFGNDNPMDVTVFGGCANGQSESCGEYDEPDNPYNGVTPVLVSDIADFILEQRGE